MSINISIDKIIKISLLNPHNCMKTSNKLIISHSKKAHTTSINFHNRLLRSTKEHKLYNIAIHYGINVKRFIELLVQFTVNTHKKHEREVPFFRSSSEYFFFFTFAVMNNLLNKNLKLFFCSCSRGGSKVPSCEAQSSNIKSLTASRDLHSRENLIFTPISRELH